MLGEAATIIITVTVVLGVMAIAAVGLRLYCRKVQKISLGGDDYCVIIALVRDSRFWYYASHADEVLDLSTGMSIVTDYAAATTGVGDPSYIPSMDAVVFALKAGSTF